MKSKNTLIQIISLLLITLWLYTALSKLMDVTLFKAQLSRQALISEFAGLLVWLLPALEIIAAILLMFTLTRKVGMLLSFSLMAIFTGYIGMVAFGIIEKSSCSCGGVLSQMGFKEHFWFNLFFFILAGLGIFLLKKDRTFHVVNKLFHRSALFRPD